MITHNVNRQIKEPKITLILDGKNKGIVNKDEALKIADDAGMDLVQINNDEYPICKIMDYGKFKYEQKKQTKKPKKTVQKEIRFRVVIDDKDFHTKEKKIIEFINKGHNVKVTMQLKGREKRFRDIALSKINTIMSNLSSLSSNGQIENGEDGIFIVLKPKVQHA